MESKNKFVNKNVFLGVDMNLFDTESVEKIQNYILEIFNQADIKWMNRSDYEKYNLELKKRQAKWKEDQEVMEWKRKPENMKKIMSFSRKLYFISNGDWFTLKQASKAGIGNYTECREILDMLYIVGFVATKQFGNIAKYKIIPDPSARLDYVGMIIGERESDLHDLLDIYRKVEKESLEYQISVIKELDQEVEKDILAAESIKRLEDLMKEKNLPKAFTDGKSLDIVKEELLLSYRADRDLVLNELKLRLEAMNKNNSDTGFPETMTEEEKKLCLETEELEIVSPSVIQKDESVENDIGTKEIPGSPTDDKLDETSEQLTEAKGTE